MKWPMPDFVLLALVSYIFYHKKDGGIESSNYFRLTIEKL